MAAPLKGANCVGSRQLTDKTTQCLQCGRQFASAKYLAMHRSALHDVTHRITRHSLRLPPVAQSPGCSGNTEQSMNQHLIDYTLKSDAEIQSCPICHKLLSHKSSLRNHQRTHTGQRPYVCEICSIGFKERYHLKKHTLYKHSDELHEQCPHCGKRFKDSTAVRAHTRIHSDLRPFSCRRCGKTFKTTECLWHHAHRNRPCDVTRRITSGRREPRDAAMHAGLLLLADSAVQRCDDRIQAKSQVRTKLMTLQSNENGMKASDDQMTSTTPDSTPYYNRY